MIEWIIGAAIVGGIFSGGGDKNKNSDVLRNTAKATLPSPPPLSIGQNSDFSDWRKQWRHEAPDNAWISKGKVTWIVENFLPFKNGNLDRVPASQHVQIEKALRLEFEIRNKKFLADQKHKLHDFFSTVERNPLTEEQMNCCICMDDAVQIVAAAGSGKTSTIVARVGYALKEKLVRPEQVLILAFNKSVQEELVARIKERLNDIEGVERINVKTFNAFGLEVIGKSAGRKPKLPRWLEHAGQDLEEMSRAVEDLRQRDPLFRLDWDMFRTVYGRDLEEFEKVKQPRASTKEQGSIQTADGKLVKSQEERMICDFLFYHGVQYEYERPYEHDTVSEEYSRYDPDFYYPSVNLYHEHFALDNKGRAPAHFSGDYVGGVKWKRATHEEKGTSLFETTSHGLRNGDDLERLRLELESRGAHLEFDESRQASGQEPIPTKQLVSTIRSFQQHVKSNGLTQRDLLNSIAKLERGHRGRMIRFVKIYGRISEEWQRRLKSEDSVDYDDMLLNAIQHIEAGAFNNPYQMVLADEFQDVSQAKLRLLKSLKDSAGPKSNLCVVGDDWQGINRFAGADISVMTGFGGAFENSTQLALSKTFRCPQALCDASSEFIQKNPQQITKTVETTNTYTVPPLHVFAAETQSSSLDRVEKHLKQLYRAAAAGELGLASGTKASVMLLGRYRKDKPGSFDAWKRAFGRYLDLGFSTAHASKGLEADYVLLLNVTSGIMGFPSQIADDPVLQLAMPEPDQFPQAEERRLFYVALTRARRQTRIYTLQDKPSRFVVELANDGYVEIKADKATMKICPKCESGTLVSKAGKFGPFEGCSQHPECDYTKKVLSFETGKTKGERSIRIKEPLTEGTTCPTCKKGTMVVRNGAKDQSFLGCSLYPRCRTTSSIKTTRQV